MLVIASIADLLESAAKVAPIVTALIAFKALTIARESLRTSRDGVASARKSVDAANASLQGAVRPILTVESATKDSITVRNDGNGIALDVGVVVSRALPNIGYVHNLSWFEEPATIPVISPGKWETFRLHSLKVDKELGPPFMALLQCRDVNGVDHWTHLLVGGGGTSVTTEIETGVHSARVEAFLIDYRDAKAERDRHRRQVTEEMLREDKAT